MKRKWRAFWQGFASVFDLFGVHHERRYKALMKDVLGKTDAEAIRSDWEAVGGDLRKAIEQVEAARKDEG
jgi:hypothetical protein